MGTGRRLIRLLFSRKCSEAIAYERRPPLVLGIGIGLRTSILPWMLGPVPLHPRCRPAAHVTGREGDADGSCPVSAGHVPDLGRVPPGAVCR